MTKKEIDLISSRGQGRYNQTYTDEHGNVYTGLINGRIVRKIDATQTTAATTTPTTVTTTITPSIALDDLTDVTLTSPAPGEALIYNGTDWVNQAAGGTGTVTSVQLTAGTGVSLSGTNPITTSGNITITNSAPDQVVSLTAGTNISIIGTYPSFTIGSTATTGLKYGVASGTNTYTVSITGVTSYTAGDAYIVSFTNGNDDDSTININGLGTKLLVKEFNVQVTGGDIVSGQDLIIIYDGTNFQTLGVAPNQLFAYVTNDDSVTINKGQPVYAYSSAGNRKLAANTSDATSAQTVGVVFSTSIAAGQKGFVITQGVISGLNTAAYAAGAQLYLGATAGTLTSTKPYAPNHIVYIGIVERSNAGNGQIYIKPQNGYELNEIHDVDLISTAPVNNDILTYVTGTPNLWKPRSIATILGYTPQAAITLTTTGTTGPATLISNTLNIPQYGGGGVTTNDAIAYAIALG